MKLVVSSAVESVPDEHVDRGGVDHPVPGRGVPVAQLAGAERERQGPGLAGGEGDPRKPLSSRTGREAEPCRWRM